MHFFYILYKITLYIYILEITRDIYLTTDVDCRADIKLGELDFNWVWVIVYLDVTVMCKKDDYVILLYS